MLLRAFKMLTGLSTTKSFKLLIAGDGPEENNLMKLAQDDGSTINACFRAFVKMSPKS